MPPSWLILSSGINAIATRKVSPLKSVDAREIDTSDKTPDAVFEEALAHIEGEQSN